MIPNISLQKSGTTLVAIEDHNFHHVRQYVSIVPRDHSAPLIIYFKRLRQQKKQEDFSTEQRNHHCQQT